MRKKNFDDDNTRVENILQIEEILLNTGRITIRVVSGEMRISYGSCEMISSNILNI